MNKRINVIAMLLTFVSTAFAQKQFVIKGTLAKDKSGLIRLTYYSMGKKYVDSTRFTGGVFEFKGMIEAPVEASIVINPLYGRLDQDQYYSQDMRDFYLEFGQNLVKGDTGLKSALIKSGQEQINFELFQRNQALLENQIAAMNPLGEQYIAANNKTGMDSLRKVVEGIRKHKDDADSSFIMEHPKSYFAFSRLTTAELFGKLTGKGLTAAYGSFAKNIRQSYQGKKLGERLKGRERLMVGKPAPEIRLLSVNDTPSLLSALKGKYVLLCFLQWPANRVLLDLYQPLLAKNVHIYAVTFSDDPLAWKSAVLESAPEWINVKDDNDGQSSRNGLVSETARAYNLIPPNIGHCLLLDTKGNILSGMMQINPMLGEKIKTIIP